MCKRKCFKVGDLASYGCIRDHPPCAGASTTHRVCVMELVQKPGVPPMQWRMSL